MNPLTFLTCTLLIFGSSVNIHAIPTISPYAHNCGNGIYCAPTQTCMSNATGAGLLYACSPLYNAVRCSDARFSCPTFTVCIEDSMCLSYDNIATDALVNVDAFQVAEMRDFGSGMKPTAFSICGAITNNFRLPNFCNCKDAKLGGELGCTIGLQNFITLGASAWVLPCDSPANVGYKAWASLIGMSKSIGETWTASFSVNVPIPGATFELGLAEAGARAELSGDISRFIISTRIAIGVCGRIGIGPFSKEICNPSIITWLPVTILQGPRFDFSRLC
jgi:hypothetical protein